MASPTSQQQARHRDGESYLAGDVIADRYVLVRPIAEGGMGIVWVAHSLTLDVDVAIKLMVGRYRKSATLGERLAQEARATARLGHSAIVRVFDFGKSAAGDPFLVMELLEGESLGDLLERDGRVPAIRAVQMMLPIADALASTHGARIVHRDLKPDNIFLARDKQGRVQPKILDFGIVKMVDEDGDHKLTRDGAPIGSPEYMSPEQARGMRDLDFSADIWSFCIVLYEMVTGEVPFTADSYNALMRKITDDPVRPITDFHAGDAALWRILDRGLRKQPEERWESMWELGEALALWLWEHGVREDICAASLKTSWLESGLSGVRIEVTSVSPPAERNSEATTDPPTPLPAATVTGEPAASRPRRPARLVIAAAVAAAIAVLFGTLAFAGRSSPAADAAESSAASPPAPPPATASAPFAPTTVAAPAGIPVEAPPSASVAAAPPPSAPPAHRASVSKKAYAGSQRPAPAPGPAPAHPRPASTSSNERDFGF